MRAHPPGRFFCMARLPSRLFFLLSPHRTPDNVKMPQDPLKVEPKSSLFLAPAGASFFSFSPFVGGAPRRWPQRQGRDIRAVVMLKEKMLSSLFPFFFSFFSPLSSFLLATRKVKRWGRSTCHRPLRFRSILPRRRLFPLFFFSFLPLSFSLGGGAFTTSRSCRGNRNM